MRKHEPAMSRKDQLLRILAQLHGHFASDDVSPADADRWRQLKRSIVRMMEGLGLARIELESDAPEVRKVRQHVRFGLGE
jgi:hypothetical protein